MALTVTVTEKEKGVFTIAPAGPIDTNTAAVLEEHVTSVLAKSPQALVFDMAGVNYISSAGVRVVLKTQREIKKNNGTMAMVNLQPRVRKVFDIIQALPAQQIFSSVEELDKYLDTIQKRI
jgi:anti-anti-sigma factor